MFRKFLSYLTIFIVVISTCYQFFCILAADKKFFLAYTAGVLMVLAWQAAFRLFTNLNAEN